MFSWLKLPEPPQATWNDVSTYYLENLKCFTYSVLDREEIPVVYLNVPSTPVNGVDFPSLVYLSQYFVQTHKGTFGFYIIPTIITWYYLQICFLLFYSEYQNAERKY